MAIEGPTALFAFVTNSTRLAPSLSLAIDGTQTAIEVSQSIATTTSNMARNLS
jgi:hypothetical protein